MPVFGADPTVEEKAFPEFTPRPAFVSGKVYGLTDHFAHHRNMKMSQRFSDEDKVMLNSYFSRALAKGFTEATLKDMVDRFFQSWAREYDQPAPAFLTAAMQDKLQQEATVVTDDPILKWLLDGMPDVGPFDFPKEIRKAVLLSGGEALHRYPEVVSEILGYNLSYNWTYKRLEALNLLIEWHLGDEEVDRDTVLATLKGIDMPRELRSRYRSPKSIRQQKDRQHVAIAAIPKKRHKHDSV